MPILKWKQGEYKALEDLYPADKAALTPLVEVVPVPWDYGDDKPTKSLDDHLAQVPDAMQKSWGVDAPMFVDLGLLEDSVRMANGTHPIAWLFDRGRQIGLQLVPVTGPDRDTAYQQAVATIAAKDGRGICLRLGPDDFDSEDVDDLVDRS